MTSRERLAEKLWPAIDAYVAACGGVPDRANGTAVATILVPRPNRIVIDRRAMRAAIVDANGFVGAAAKTLGVTRCTLMRRMREAGLDECAREWRRKTGWRYGRPRKCS